MSEMLFDPDKRTRIDEGTTVPTGDTGRAHKMCRDEVAKLQKQGNVVRHVGVRKNRSGRSHQCIQEFELDEQIVYLT